jgi:hypothetical protein
MHRIDDRVLADDDPGAGGPAFKEELTRIASATRFNLQLCNGI